MAEKEKVSLTLLEAKKLEREIEQIEVETDSSRLELASKAQEFEDDAARSDPNRVYHFFGSVDTKTVKHAIQTIEVWARRDPGEEITIIFNSPGGSVIDGLALYDFLIKLRETTRIVTVARGMAASMGGVLLQAGTERIVGANAHLLIHEVPKLASGNLSELEDEVKFAKRLQDRLLDILAERSTLSKGQIKRKWTRADWWIGAEETLEFGFADEVG